MLIRVSDDLHINLQNVSSIMLLQDKQILNMSYTIEDNKNGEMCGYYYIDAKDFSYQNTEYFKNNFILIKGSERTIYVNVNHISFVKKDLKNTPKLIIGIDNSVKRKEISRTAEYLYIRISENILDKMYNSLIDKINNIIIANM